MVNSCHNCKSDNVDLSNTGLPNALECLDCGLIFANVKQSWPFPTSLVNKPLNDIPVKIDGLKDAQEAPF